MRRIRVVAAVIEREGRLLITRRHDRGERAGLWEFPGGKVEAGEDEPTALAREIREELGVSSRIGELYRRLSHPYPELTVELALYRVQLDDPLAARPLEAADLRWVPHRELPKLPFCEADLPVLADLAAEGEAE